MNAAERGTEKLKEGMARNMVKAKSPKYFLDHYLELEALIPAHSSHDVYNIKGKVVQTFVLDETANILPFCKLDWWDWG